MDTTQEFFQLRRRPFDKDLPDESLWLDPDRTDAVDRLVDAIQIRVLNSEARPSWRLAQA